MTEYRITGRHYLNQSGTSWYWSWDVERTEPNTNGVVVNFPVDSGAEPWRWLAVLKGRWAVRSDRYRQRQKSKPIDIRIGGKK